MVELTRRRHGLATNRPGRVARPETAYCQPHKTAASPDAVPDGEQNLVPLAEQGDALPGFLRPLREDFAEIERRGVAPGVRLQRLGHGGTAVG